ncbi:MAG: hypothetical protein IPL61_32190 [Myxococcales bacterium]|nr:hypothetical protein [Myxococcales bacterium]
MKLVAQALLATALAAGCSSGAGKPKTPNEPPPPPKPAVRYDAVTRADFNQRAATRALPLFWRTDADGDNTLDPDELVALWGWDGPALDTLIKGGAFTPAFEAIYASLTKPIDPAAAPAADRARQTALLAELAQGAPTLVETDLRAASEEDLALIDHITKAATLIERVHARQNGVLGMADKIPAGDTVSRMVFFRNQSPVCLAPKTESDPACTAVAGVTKPPVGLYPAALQANPKFCAKMTGPLADHFAVVVEGAKGLEAVPYNVAYKDDLEAIAVELEAAAAAITTDDEAAFKAYLTAAAQAFRDNDWERADVAWAAMGDAGSKWYLRVGPDEVYYEPCALKAGFHLGFAYINPGSVEWRDRLTPLKDKMEQALAKLAGKPYKARKVGFRLPDFIDIIVNAGDARSNIGATIGQSLPNWGKVSDAGGRTVAMTNLYTDADSAANLTAQTSSLFCAATQAKVSTEPSVALMSTVLHEAAHNLGPSHDYKVKGKTDDAIFGGPMAAMMEELKAQTAALYFVDWLAKQGALPADLVGTSHVRDVAWAFGHVANGMYASNGSPKTYSQLAAIQLGTLFAAGVLQWDPEAQAANGTDTGCFELDLDAWPAAVDKLAARVLAAKGKGDKKDALAMKATFVDGADAWGDLRATIAERWLRAPKASFVYSLRR